MRIRCVRYASGILAYAFAYGLFSSTAYAEAPATLNLAPLSTQADQPYERRAPAHAANEIIPRPDEDLLIFQLTLDRQQISDAVLGYTDGDDFLISLQDIIKALELNIEINADNTKAEGWILSENRTFKLDLNAGTVTLLGQTKPIESGMVERHENDIFVSRQALQSWFPLLLDIKYNELDINVSTLEPFPIQVRNARENARKNIRKATSERPDYPLLVTTPDMFEWPTVSTNTEVGYNSANKNGNEKTLRTTYQLNSIFLGHDLTGSLNSTLLGTNKETNARLRLTREDPDSQLLGSLHLSRYELGDIYNPSIPLIADSKGGRGVSATNMPLNRRGANQTVTLRGDLPIGYQVDLMRNGTLLSFKDQPSDTGEYVFEDVPAFPGLNEYELIFYGPQGQRITEKRNLFVESDNLEKGFLGLTVHATQQDRNLIDTRDIKPVDSGNERILMQADYGLTNDISVYGGYADITYDKKQSSYGYAGIKQRIFGILSNFYGALSSPRDITNNGIEDKTNGYALGGQLEGINEDLSWQLSHQYFHDYESEGSDGQILGDIIESATRLRANSNIGLFGMHIPLSGEIGYETNRDNDQGIQLVTRTSGTLSPFRFTIENSTDWVTDRDTQSTMSLRVTTPIGRLNLRGETSYELTPDPRLSDLTFFADYPLNDRIGVRAGYSRSDNGLNSKTLNRYITGLNYQFDSFILGFNMEMDQDGEILALAQISSDFGYVPETKEWVRKAQRFSGQGTILSRAFIDEDNDKIYSAGVDEPLEGINFRGDSVDQKVVTNAEGQSLLIGLAPYQDSMVEIQDRNLPDPLLIPSVRGYYVRTRPATVTPIDFPVMRTGEIDGDVIIKSWNGATKPARNMTIAAIDIQGTVPSATTTSAFDGFYLLSRLPLGKYKIAPDPAQLEKLGLCPPLPHIASITKDEPVISLDPLYVRPAPDPENATAITAIRLGTYKTEEIAMTKRAEFMQKHADILGNKTYFTTEDETAAKGKPAIQLLYGPYSAEEGAQACATFKKGKLVKNCDMIEVAVQMPPCAPIPADYGKPEPEAPTPLSPLENADDTGMSIVVADSGAAVISAATPRVSDAPLAADGISIVVNDGGPKGKKQAKAQTKPSEPQG